MQRNRGPASPEYAANGSTLESVTYNPTGDRLSKTGSGLATGTYGYNPNTHQLVSTGSYARSVDANGNTTGISAASGNLGFGYNDRNRMILAQVAGSTVGSYTYDALGERIQKISGTASETYSYDEGQQLLSEQGATNRDYVWRGGIPVANVDTTGSTSTLAYVTADQLGTPRAIANASGTTEWSWPYAGNAWGEVAPTSTGYTYNLRFPGQYFDQETGLNYNVNRDYDTSIGRYIESDPLGLYAGQPSTYAYVDGMPLVLVDPNGYGAKGALIGGVIGGGIGSVLGGAVGGAGGAVLCSPSGPGAIACVAGGAEAGSSAGGGGVGAGLGAAIGSKIQDMCDGKGNDCEKQEQEDEQMCRMATMPGTGARARCWESVKHRYFACVNDLPIPRLVIW